MVKVIHLSDLHIHGSMKKADNQNAETIVKYLLGKYAGAPKENTYVVITGDCVDDAGPRQFRRLQENILSQLSEVFTVLAVPGNHDYAYAGNFFAEDGPERFRSYVSEYIGDNGTYPYKRVNEDERVLLLGLDSADKYDKKWFAEGVVGSHQRDELGGILNSEEYKEYFKIVYLHHHPFLRDYGMALREHEELLRLFVERVDLVLFGHKHNSEVFFGRYLVPLMLASGKVTETNGDALAFRVVEIDKGKVVSVQTEEIDSEPHRSRKRAKMKNKARSKMIKSKLKLNSSLRSKLDGEKKKLKVQSEKRIGTEKNNSYEF